MDLGLKGKVADVAGADGGLGKAIAAGFAMEGARVARVCKTAKKGEAAASSGPAVSMFSGRRF